jgi:2-polyprenyl-6-methoxyphenol hydroxylase-like FAD-dependent oxidoreductase
MAPQVVIAGAGPTGLVLAVWLSRLGIGVRITVDKAPEPGTTSCALAVQARTLELYKQIGLARTLVDHPPRATRRRGERRGCAAARSCHAR